MKLKGKEKEVWWHFMGINDSKDIPIELNAIYEIDTSLDDDFLYFITLRVKIIKEITLKDTLVTDQGVIYISDVQQLKRLTLAKHPTITNKALPYLNKLIDLDYLDITKTKINLEELSILSDLRNLKELYITSEEMDKELLLERIIGLKEMLPNCIVYVNYERY